MIKKKIIMGEKCCSSNECCGGFKLGNMLPTNTIEEVEKAIEITNNEISLHEQKCSKLYSYLDEYKKIRGDMEFIKISNEGIVGKFFYSDNGASSMICSKDDKIISYFRVMEIISKQRDGIHAKIELFSKMECNDGKTLFRYTNYQHFIYFSDLRSEKEVDKDTFYQKRDEFINEYKTYMS